MSAGRRPRWCDRQPRGVTPATVRACGSSWCQISTTPSPTWIGSQCRPTPTTRSRSPGTTSTSCRRWTSPRRSSRCGRAWPRSRDAPSSCPLAWTGTRHYGDPVVADWIDRWRPTAVLTGHIHQAPFTPQGSWAERIGDTWLFNAGKQPGPAPSHVELDLARGLARWVSYQGVEERDLTGTGGLLERHAGTAADAATSAPQRSLQ